MTSASSKIEPSLFNLFVNSKRDIMPACIATSFPHINSDVYNRDYVRDNIANCSESSSPESSGYEDFHNQIVHPLNFTEKLSKTSLHLTKSPKKKTEAKWEFSEAAKHRSKNCNFEINKKMINEPHESSREFSKKQKKRISDEHQTSLESESHSSNHSIKRKTNEKNIGKRKEKDFDQSPKNLIRDLDSRLGPNHPNDILQRMYNSFGKNLNGHLAKCSFSESLKELDRNKRESNEERKSPHRIDDDSSDENKMKRWKLPQHESNLTPELFSKTKTNIFPEDSKSSPSPPGDEGNTESGLHRNKTPVNNKTKLKKDKYCSRKRKQSGNNHESFSRETNYSRDRDATASPKQPKRSRYSSSESNDSQTRHQNAPDFYKSNNPWLPFLNSMFYSPAALGSFGMPTPGCHFPLPGMSPPNPLMFNTNPYLSNPVFMRDMMTQARMSHLMPLFSNPNFSSMGPGAGISPQQLQAIQQLQSSFMYPNHPSMIPRAGCPTNSGILPTMQSNFFSTSQRLGDISQLAAERKSCEPKTRSQSNQSSSSESQPKFVEKPQDINSRMKLLSNFTNHNSQTNSFDHTKTYPDDQVNAHKRPQIKSTHQSNSKKDDIPRPHHSYKQRPSPTKKKSEKRKESTKSKEIQKEKSISDPSLIEQTQTLSNEESQDSFERDSSTPGPSGSVKSPSYKNLTRERRLVANARERTRVHTISSAFDELRGQIPSYSCNQKLSKLAILRIACEYIRTLSVLAGHDETTTLGQGVDKCTRVLQSESRARSRRKNNKAQIEWEMANYDRHQSLDEGDVTEEPIQNSAEDTSYRYSLSPSGNPSPTNDFSADKVAVDDVVENDNELVDVEGIDDDKEEENKT